MPELKQTTSARSHTPPLARAQTALPKIPVAMNPRRLPDKVDYEKKLKRLTTTRQLTVRRVSDSITRAREQAARDAKDRSDAERRRIATAREHKAQTDAKLREVQERLDGLASAREKWEDDMMQRLECRDQIASGLRAATAAEYAARARARGEWERQHKEEVLDRRWDPMPPMWEAAKQGSPTSHHERSSADIAAGVAPSQASQAHRIDLASTLADRDARLEAAARRLEEANAKVAEERSARKQWKTVLAAESKVLAGQQSFARDEQRRAQVSRRMAERTREFEQSVSEKRRAEEAHLNGVMERAEKYEEMLKERARREAEERTARFEDRRAKEERAAQCSAEKKAAERARRVERNRADLNSQLQREEQAAAELARRERADAHREEMRKAQMEADATRHRLNTSELSQLRAEYIHKQEQAQRAMGPCGGEGALNELLESLTHSQQSLAQSLSASGDRFLAPTEPIVWTATSPIERPQWHV